MPILDWIGKKQVINHDKEVPFRLLKRVESLSVGESENLIIKGDNLEALKALLPYYYNKVKCIYIDPPYNTGNENWIYNDKVNSPEIKKWLGRVVGSEGEDLSRHDKWLCMMYPRLKLLRELLADDGVIVIHIDENAYSYLHLLLSEIFGENNELGTIIWDKKNPKGDATKISYQHESILVFSKNYQNVNGLMRKKKNANAILKKAKELFIKSKKNDLENINLELKKWINKQDFSGGETAYSNIDENGDVYRPVSMAWPNKQKAPDEYFIPLIHPTTKKPCPIPERGWRFPPKSINELVAKNEILFGKDEKTIPNRKYLLKENLNENIPSVIRFGGSDDKFQNELGIKFENPKPFTFATELLGYFTKVNDIILDSFAGSGTTAHAVLELNKEDRGNRKFILVEMEDEIARKVTAERVKRVVKGYTYKNSKGADVKVKGLGGGFQFMNLDTELFNAHGLINDDISYTDLARYIFFSETKLDLKEKAMKDYFIGDNNGAEYYLVFKQGKENILNEKIVSKLKKTDKKKVVYADNCTLDSDMLNERGVTFKQIPYEVRAF